MDAKNQPLLFIQLAQVNRHRALIAGISPGLDHLAGDLIGRKERLPL